MPANAGNTRPRKPKNTNPDHKEANTTAKPKKPTQTKSPKLTPDQNKEFKRVRATEERQRRKELGLCQECPNQAIKGQTCCPDCANKHSTARAKAQKHQRNSADTGNGPIQESDFVLGTEGPAKKTHSQSPTKHRRANTARKTAQSEERRAYDRLRSQRPERKETARQIAKNRRDRRIAAGLCDACEGPPIPGQTRCEACAEKHRISRRKSDAKRRGQPAPEKKTHSQSPTKHRRANTARKTAQSEERRAYDRLRSQRPERKETARQIAKNRRDRRIAAGLCDACEGPPIPGQTRCEACAEKHRISRRKSDAKRRGQPAPEATTPTDASQQ